MNGALCLCFLVLMGSFYLLAVPLSGGYGDIAEFKFSLYFPLAAGFVVLSVLTRGEARLIGAPRSTTEKKALRVCLVDGCAAAYLICTGISALLSRYPGTLWGNGRRDGVLTIGSYVLIFLILRRSFPAKGWLLGLFSGTVACFCVLGLVQLTGANPMGLYPAGYNFYGAGVYYPGEYWSTMGNADLCAAFLSLAAGGLTAAVIRARERRGWLLLLPLCLCVFPLLELHVEAGLVALLAGGLLLLPLVVASPNQGARALCCYGALTVTLGISQAVSFFDGGVRFSPSRGFFLLALAGGAAGAAGMVLVRRGLSHNSSKMLRRWLLLGVLGVGLTGLGILYFRSDLPDGFLRQAHLLLRGQGEDSFGSGRLYIWRQVLPLVGEAPLFGGGPDSLAFRGLEGFTRYNETLGQMVGSYIDTAHNEYLNILVNQGLLALSAYLALLLCSLIHWWRNPEDDMAAVGGAAALFYLIQAFFGISMCLTAPFLWIGLALLNHTGDHKKEKRDVT